MKTKYPKPVLKPFVPNIIGIGILTAQVIVMVIGNVNEPSCKIELEKPHYSTSMSRELGIDAIKLNITSECTVPQTHTSLSGNIYMTHNGQERTVFKFENESRKSDPKNPNVVRFLNLFEMCKKGTSVSYRSDAIGFAYLENGKSIPLNDNSGSPFPQNCKIGAQ